MEMSFDGDFEVGIPREKLFTLLADPEAFQLAVDTLVDRYKDKGIDVVLGVESGSPRVLASIQKNITPAQIEQATRLAKQVGMLFENISRHDDGRAVVGIDAKKEAVSFARQLRASNPGDGCFGGRVVGVMRGKPRGELLA